jgi:hypothetical protein
MGLLDKITRGLDQLVKRKPGVMKDVGKKVIEAAAVVAAGANPTGAMVAGGIHALDGLLDRRLQEYRDKKVADAFDALVNEMAGIVAFSRDPASEMRDLIGSADDATLETLLNYFRHLADAIDPQALQYIARLTAPYLAHKRQRDRFFKLAARVLVDVDSLELSEFEDLFTAVREISEQSNYVIGEAVPKVTIRQDVNKYTISIGDGSDQKEGYRKRSVRRALDVLRFSGLCVDGGSGAGGAAISFPLAHAHDFVKLLDLFAPRVRTKQRLWLGSYFRRDRAVLGRRPCSRWSSAKWQSRSFLPLPHGQARCPFTSRRRKTSP